MVSYKKQIEDFKIKWEREPQPFELCSRFETCQLNKCPLHPDYKKLKNDSSDPSQKGKKQRCITKDRRKKIAFAIGLKSMGLTIRETSAFKSQEKFDLSLEKSKQGDIAQQNKDKKKSERDKSISGVSGMRRCESSKEGD